MTSYFQLIVIHFWQNILAIKNPLDLILAPSKAGDAMCSKGYLITQYLYHLMS